MAQSNCGRGGRMALPGSNKRMGMEAGFVPRSCHHDTRGSPSNSLAQKTGTIANSPIRHRGGAYIPKDFPPRSTLHDYFTWWHCDGTLDRIHHALYVECREKAEREASPTACIIDSQSVKSAEKGGPALILTGSMRAN